MYFVNALILSSYKLWFLSYQIHTPNVLFLRRGAVTGAASGAALSYQGHNHRVSIEGASLSKETYRVHNLPKNFSQALMTFWGRKRMRQHLEMEKLIFLKPKNALYLDISFGNALHTVDFNFYIAPTGTRIWDFV